MTRMNLIGNVDGKVALIADDEIASGGTLCEAATFLKQHGATRVLAVATHGVFSGNAIQRIEAAPIDQIFVTDTIPASAAAAASSKVEITPVAELFARAISRIHDGRSVSSLF